MFGGNSSGRTQRCHGGACRTLRNQHQAHQSQQLGPCSGLSPSLFSPPTPPPPQTPRRAMHIPLLQKRTNAQRKPLCLVLDAAGHTELTPKHVPCETKPPDAGPGPAPRQVDLHHPQLVRHCRARCARYCCLIARSAHERCVRACVRACCIIVCSPRLPGIQ